MKCPECGSYNVIYFPDRGEYVCGACGLVLSERTVDRGPEWRVFTPEQRLRKSRVGAPETYRIHDRGLTTTIDWKNKDYSGKVISGLGYLRAKKLRRLQRRIRISGSTERKMVQILSKINRTVATLGLPESVLEEASRIARMIVDAKLVRGRFIDNYVAAAIYAACRFQKVNRTLDDIARKIGVPKKSAAQAYRKIYKLFKEKPPILRPQEYIPKLVSSLKLPAVVQTKAAEILKLARERGLTAGKGPIGLAAASIYCASVFLDFKKTQREIAEKANVTEVTVRNRYKEIIDYFMIRVNL